MFQICSRCVPEKAPYALAGNITPSLTLYPPYTLTPLPDWCYLITPNSSHQKVAGGVNSLIPRLSLPQSRSHTVLGTLIYHIIYCLSYELTLIIKKIMSDMYLQLIMGDSRDHIEHIHKEIVL